MLDTLEREGNLLRNIKNRKKIGEVNLALSANLDYYSFLLVPAVNRSRKVLLADAALNPTGIKTFNNKYLGMTYFLESTFKQLITVDELIKQMVLEVMAYTKILIPYPLLGKKQREIKQLEDATKIIVEVLKDNHKNTKQWYDFVNSLRNFITHEGVLTIDYIDNNNIFFYKKRWDKRFKISMNIIIKRLNEFMKIRKVLREGLSDPNFWKTKMGI